MNSMPPIHVMAATRWSQRTSSAIIGYSAASSARSCNASTFLRTSRPPSSTTSPSLSQRLTIRIVVSTVVPVMSAGLCRVR